MPERDNKGPALRHCVLAALCSLHLGLTSWSAAWYAVALDEPQMLGGGMWTLQTGRSDVYTQTPPLTKVLTAVPYWFSGVRLDLDEPLQPGGPSAATLGYTVLDATSWERSLIFASRCCLLPFSVLMLTIIWCWTRTLAGTPAAILATLCWTLYPPALTWAAIGTADYAVASMILLCGFLSWKLLRAPTLFHGWLAGLGFGFGMLVKSTLLILLAAVPLLVATGSLFENLKRRRERRPSRPCRNEMVPLSRAAFWCWLRWALPARSLRPSERERFDRDGVQIPVAGREEHAKGASRFHPDAPHRGLALAALFLTSFTLLWGGYLGDGFGEPIGSVRYDPRRIEKAIADTTGAPGLAKWVGSVPLPVPKAFLRGVLYQSLDFKHDRVAYFWGENRPGGWWWWYAAVYAIKTPIGYGLLGLIAITRIFRQPTIAAGKVRSLSYLLFLALLLLTVVSCVGFSIYWRYALGFVPPLMIVLAVLCLPRQHEPHRRTSPWLISCCVAMLLIAWETLGDMPRLHGRVNWAARMMGPPHAWLKGQSLDYGVERHLPGHWAQQNPGKRPFYFALPLTGHRSRHDYLPTESMTVLPSRYDEGRQPLPQGWYLVQLSHQGEWKFAEQMRSATSRSQLGDCYQVIRIEGVEAGVR